MGYLGIEVMGPAEQWQPEPALPRRETRKKLNPFLSVSPKLLIAQRKVCFFVVVSLKTETSGTSDHIWTYYKIFLQPLLGSCASCPPLTIRYEVPTLYQIKWVQE